MFAKLEGDRTNSGRSSRYAEKEPPGYWNVLASDSSRDGLNVGYIKLEDVLLRYPDRVVL